MFELHHVAAPLPGKVRGDAATDDTAAADDDAGLFGKGKAHEVFDLKRSGFVFSEREGYGFDSP